MSRLTQNPFHKPSAIESLMTHSGRPPISPPETQHDFSHALNTTASVARGIETPSGETYRGIDGLPEQDSLSNPSMTPAARFRKVSTLAYLNSNLRESRERGVQRSSLKSFIVIIPPSSVIEDHGSLGHTLSSGPPGRLSQGILMPLFPTFYAQVTAISREFNFPSTSGLCLYLHYTDSGITTTPRISDDSWPMMWNHVFDPSSPTSAGGRPPIVGKIEFDIDLRIARWYSSWLASASREQFDTSMSLAPSAAPSIAHYRGDSRTTIPQEDENLDERSAAGRQTSLGTARHIPKKLSLIDRFDVASVRGTSRAPSRPAMTPPEMQEIPPSQNLSPIVQEEEPKSSKLQSLESKVMSWRASASLKPSALASAGQTSLEPANMPNSVRINDEEALGDEEELNLDEFTWSVTSAGPNYDEDYESQVTWYRLPSVHMARRAEGSVCLTPSDCTSFGPSDYTLPSIASEERLPSPDIANRMYEDCPPTPSDCTSWGAPSCLYSPVSIERLPSPDLAHRFYDDCPPTPSTCTSWGAPLGWPDSPAPYSRPPSVDLGHRGVYSRPATPSTATSWGAPLSFPPSPMVPEYVHTPGIGQLMFDESDGLHPAGALSFPYYDPVESSGWGFTWPYYDGQSGQSNSESNRLSREGDSASFPATPMSWPYFKLTPTDTWKEDKEHSSRLTFRRTINVRLTSYPHIELYAPQYPHNLAEIYPIVVASARSTSAVSSNERLQSMYPHFVLYPPVYPHNLRTIYAGVPNPGLREQVRGSIALSTPLGKQSRGLVITAARYPTFCLYPAVYPKNLDNLYPAVDLGMASTPEIEQRANSGARRRVKGSGSSQSVKSAPSAVEVNEFSFPNIDPTGAQPWQHCWPYTPAYSREVPVSSERLVGRTTVSNKLDAGYPWFSLYPIQYPDNLSRIYPKTVTRVPSSHGIDIYVPCLYPNIQLYKPVYPYNLLSLYPKVLARKRDDTGITIMIKPLYPNVQIYQPVYPYNLRSLYPKIHVTKSVKSRVPIKINLLDPEIQPKKAGYPLNLSLLYPKVCSTSSEKVAVSVKTKSLDSEIQLQKPGYPLNLTLLYPKVGSTSSGMADVPVKAKSLDSEIQLHKPGYPLNLTLLYPKVCYTDSEKRDTSVLVKPLYPNLQIYQPVYPHNLLLLYPKQYVRVDSRNSHVSIMTPVVYPYLQLYKPVYPHNLLTLYPTLPLKIGKRRTVIIVNARPVYPVLQLYEPVYPHNLLSLYPGPSGSVIKNGSFSRPTSALIEKENGVPNSSPSSIPIASSQYPVFRLYPRQYPFNLADLYPAVVYDDPTPSQVRYGTFLLYPAVYPDNLSEIYPSIKPRMMVRPSLRRRLRHIDLHNAVLEENGIKGMIHMHRRKPRKSHQDLHNEELLERAISFTATGSSPISASAGNRPTSSQKRSPIGPPPALGLPALPPVEEGGRPSLPQRSVSLRRVGEPRPLGGTQLTRSTSAASQSGQRPSERPQHRKRDSLVLQRIQAFNSISETSRMPVGAPKS